MWCCTGARNQARLGLEAEGEVLGAGDGGLVHADAQRAVAGREGRRHDLLRADHLPEQLEVAHAPRELAAARRGERNNSLAHNAGREGRRHDLLRADHLPEQLEVAHAPRELAAARRGERNNSLAHNAGREGRRHDLLRADHLPEQLEVAHAPRELAAARRGERNRSLARSRRPGRAAT